MTETVNGLAKLSKILMQNHFEEVNMINELEFKNYKKRNEKMHFLRIIIKNWKHDSAARQQFYDKREEFEIK